MLPLEAALENSEMHEPLKPLHVGLGHIGADIISERQNGNALGVRLES
jgi:hypothetical protein